MTTILTPRRSLSLLPVLSALVPLPSYAADAPEPDAGAQEPWFGDAHQLAISGATQMNANRIWITGTGEGSASYQTTFFNASGAADYFVVRGLSVGLRAGYSHMTEGGYPSSDDLLVGPRVGYNVRLTKQWSLWPDVSASYEVVWDGVHPSSHATSLGVYAPVVFHPASHFFLGLGPEATSVGFSGGSYGGVATTLALEATVGGWVGL